MDFTLTEEQTELAALTRRIVTDHATPERLRTLETKGTDRFDPDLWAALATAGILSATLPESAGGSGPGLLERCAIMVELGRAVAPVPYLPTVAVAAAALARFGSPEVRDRWVPAAATGKVILTAALETPTTVTATESDGTWTLTGTTPLVPAAPLASALLIPASRRSEHSESAFPAQRVGVSGTPHPLPEPPVFIVQPSDPGVTIARQRTVDLDDAGLVELSEVALPADRVLGGSEVLAWLRSHALVGLCATQLGITERALELTAEYARTREQFGRPIGGFQAVSQRLAEAHLDVEAIRLTLWQAAWLLATGRPAEREIATAKFWAADGGHRVAHTAVHVHGGVGIDTDHPLHRYFIAAKRTEFALGAAPQQLLTLGTLLAAE